MDPITNKPNLPPTTNLPPTNDPVAKSADPATAKSIQQIPVDTSYSGYLGSADEHFDFIKFAKRPENLEGMLESLSIKLERTSFSLAKQDMKEYLNEVQRYNDAQREVKELPLISQERVKRADGEIGEFAAQLNQDLAKAKADKTDAQSRVDQFTGDPGKADELAAAQGDLAAADGKITNLEGQLRAVNYSPDTKDQLRVTAMLIENMGLTTDEEQQIYREVVSSGRIPADMLGGMAGPEAKAAAERANEGLNKLQGDPGGINVITVDPALINATDPVTLAAIVDGGSLTHPAITIFNGMTAPEGADIALQKILNGLYSNSEAEKSKQDIIDQIAATIDVVAQRFSGKEEVDENIKLEFRNKISI